MAGLFSLHCSSQTVPRPEYPRQPYFLDEYGGIKWVSGAAFAANSWGYGDGPKAIEEYYDRLN